MTHEPPGNDHAPRKGFFDILDAIALDAPDEDLAALIVGNTDEETDLKTSLLLLSKNRFMPLVTLLEKQTSGQREDMLAALALATLTIKAELPEILCRMNFLIDQGFDLNGSKKFSETLASIMLDQVCDGFAEEMGLIPPGRQRDMPHIAHYLYERGFDYFSAVDAFIDHMLHASQKDSADDRMTEEDAQFMRQDLIDALIKIGEDLAENPLPQAPSWRPKVQFGDFKAGRKKGYQFKL